MSAWSGGWFGAWYGDWLGANQEAGAASGVVLTVDASLLAGVATGRFERRPSVAGPPPQRRPQTIPRDGRAPGELLVCYAKILPGRARAARFLHLGRARGSATATGALVMRRAVLQPVLAMGTTYPEISEEEFMILAEAA